jgi:peptidoglycan hydrolase-like protein with peptidoglycan-binding domain
MKKDPGRASESKSFDLLSNPFALLRLEPTATLDRIAESYDDALADHVAAEDILLSARESLVNPRQRTAAELTYLIDTPPGEVDVILNALRRNAQQDELLRMANRLAPISKANLLAHVASVSAASADILFSLVEAHASIRLDAVETKLKSVRRAASLVLPSGESLNEALSEVVARHARSAFLGFANARDSVDPLMQCVRRIFVTSEAEKIGSLGEIISAFSRFASTELSRIEKDVQERVASLRAQPAALSLVAPLAITLRNWGNLAGPLLDFESRKGRDEERARTVFNEVRGLAIDLANEHESYDVALAISEVALEIFRLLPRGSQQLEQDLRLLEERSSEALVLPLKKRIDSLQESGTSGFIRDLETGGFQRSAVREARELWDEFLSAVARTVGTATADLPWILMRSLAIEINNEDNAPNAARIMLRGMKGAAVPSARIDSMISADLETIERNIKEKKLLEELNAGQTSSALGTIHDLLQSTADPEQRETLSKLKTKLESQRARRYAKWAVGIAIAAFVIYANMPVKPSLNGSSYNLPTAVNTQSTSYPGGQSRPPSGPSPVTTPKAQLPLEEMPAVGSGILFSQNNIRYCRYQKERLKNVGSDLRGNHEIELFNRLVDDYNSRCANFQYRANDLEIVVAELSGRANALAAEARGIVEGWRKPLPLSRTSIASSIGPSPIGSARSVETPENSAVSVSQNADLLELPNALLVQKRLADLGYFNGPINGTWGPVSRNSLRSFKSSNGLANDDLYDVATAEALHSSQALRSTSAASSEVSNKKLPESSYTPPVGATLNPLNRADATKIHSKLRSLGLYSGNSNTLWSEASRHSLKLFRTYAGLETTDQWDAQAEQRLLSPSQAQTADFNEAAFFAAIGGTWAADVRFCPGASASGESAAISITAKRAETGAGRCEFGPVAGGGSSWKSVAVCSVSGETWTANVSLVRIGNILTWSSERGSTKYRFCAN